MDERGFEGINVIPFIDIMLVLLTIVLTTATFMANGSIPVQLPKAKEGVSDGLGLIVVVNVNGKIFFKDKEYSLDDLLTVLHHENRQTPFVIRADKAVALQSFVDVMDTAKGLGFSKVSLQTEVMK